MYRKAKDLIPDVAKELGKNAEEVNDVVDFYYKELRNKLESLKHPRVFVRELGVFYLSKKKLEESIEKLSVIVEKATPETFKEVSIVETKKALIVQQKEILSIINVNRKEYERKKNMEK